MDWTPERPGPTSSPGSSSPGVGVGLVNPPLASTAVGVVPPRLAGMSSGINSTFRQVGTATGIALLGTLFASRLGGAITTAAAGTPLAGKSSSLAGLVQSGELKKALPSFPKAQIPIVERIAATGFTSALNDILLISSVVTLVTAVASLALIRNKDFHDATTGESAQEFDPA
ncbi:MFS transporter [Leekyejoonella antrihumi]|uniref:MFS transporter n=1 Tax=Leekyejoonella antrihumi TaxID=1660198 RepID=A0A563E7E0_9MICO|nr:MFS transporter [Leekyejoonella antrihumi]TWP38219.1 MFS transporter [Leekyejoonella antrihumi]